MTKIKSEIYIKIKTSISIGFALFAMLFGAGNIIFPLYLGANTEKNIPIAIIGFLLTGVGAPFLGLFATTLFNGDYWNFFCRLGKVPAIIIVSFLIIIIGPLIAIPRTESIIWNSVSLYLPEQIQYHYVFSIAYCLLLLILSIKETKIINILGLILSPIKIITFSILIIIGLFFTDQTKTIIIEKTNLLETFNKSILIGYSTMDLLATFFFANIAFKSIQTKNENKTNITIITLASAIGAILIGITYIGFILLSNKYKNMLKEIPIENILISISQITLGKFGGVFICICLSFACLATALALTQVSKTYLYEEIFKKKVPNFLCLSIIIIITFTMSHLKFQNLMNLTIPILEIFYPTLITICIMNILFKLKNVKTIKIPVLVTIILSFLFAYIY